MAVRGTFRFADGELGDGICPDCGAGLIILAVENADGETVEFAVCSVCKEKLTPDRPEERGLFMPQAFLKALRKQRRR